MIRINLSKNIIKKSKNITIIFLIIAVVFGSFHLYGLAATPSTVSHNCLYYIKNVNSGKFLTVTANGNIVQQSKNNNENQRFFIRNSSFSNYYTLTPDSNYNLRVDIANSLDADYTNVGTFQENPAFASAQCFKFIQNSDGSYKIMPKLSTTRVLDVTDASTAENANIQLFTKHADSSQYATAQNWYIYKVANSLLSWDLVDSGKHLDYFSESSTYLSYAESAATVWNSHIEGVVRKDNALRTREVDIVDAQNLGNAVAITTGGGEIQINTSSFSDLSDEQKLNLFIHEIGHALGMGHQNSKSNVLYYTVNSTTTLKKANKDSYDLAYERY